MDEKSLASKGSGVKRWRRGLVLLASVGSVALLACTPEKRKVEVKPKTGAPTPAQGSASGDDGELAADPAPPAGDPAPPAGDPAPPAGDPAPPAGDPAPPAGPPSADPPPSIPASPPADDDTTPSPPPSVVPRTPEPSAPSQPGNPSAGSNAKKLSLTVSYEGFCAGFDDQLACKSP